MRQVKVRKAMGLWWVFVPNGSQMVGVFRTAQWTEAIDFANSWNGLYSGVVSAGRR